MSFPDPAAVVTPGSDEQLDPGEVRRFTPRQREILGLKADGHSNAEISEMLGISESTVRFQLHRARLKLSTEKSAQGAGTSDQLAWDLRSQTTGRQPVSGSSSRPSWPESSFIGRLDYDDRDALLSAGTPCRFEDEQILLVQGNVDDFAYVLISGFARVVVAAESGLETTLAIHSRGDLEGEFGLLEEGPHPWSIRAMGFTTALRISSAAFTAIASESPAMQMTVTRYALSKLRASAERRAAERLWDARERLVQVLYELGLAHGEYTSNGAVRLPFTQGDLGDLAGVAVSTSERVLAELRRQGTISTRYREIVINDMAYLDSIRLAGS